MGQIPRDLTISPTEVGGFMLLHHLFKELVLIEVESSSDIWPIADRVLP